jgi:putative ABC transport system permease protein
MLGLLGTIIGSLTSLAIIYSLNISKLSFSFGRQENLVLEPTVATGDVIMVCAMVMAVAVLASLQPAWKASRMEPITALRHV